MKFFNLDLHIAVISDIKRIFEDLGHQVDDWTLSKIGIPLIKRCVMRFMKDTKMN